MNAMLIAAPVKPRAAANLCPINASIKKVNQWYFGMKAHIGVNADSGLVHTVWGSSANVNDVVEENCLMGPTVTAMQVSKVHFPSQYTQGLERHIARMRHKRKAPNPLCPIGALNEPLE